MRTLGMKDSLLGIAMVLGFVGVLAGDAAAQPTVGAAPTLIPVSGQFVSADGQPRTGFAVLVLSLYEGKDDPAPRWIEFQTVTLDAQGRYDVRFGATREDGLPPDLFAGAAGTRWIGVGIENEPEQPRVMLVSVPYAAKAVEADTLAGRSPSDFVLASSFRDDLKTALAEEGVRTGTGSIGTAAVTVNYLQKGAVDGITTDSTAYETPGGNIGIGTTTPVTRLDIVGDTTNSSLKAGALEIQSYNVNNNWLADNLYFSGGFRYRANGTAAQMYFDNGDIVFYTAPSGAAGALANRRIRLAISAGGNIGIGTVAPVAGLDIIADPTNSSLKVGGLEFQTYSLNNNWLADNLYYNGGFRYRASGTASQIYFDQGDVVFYTAPAGAAGAVASRIAQMVLTSAGNVGIGTFSPSSRLHVVGNTRITGDIVVDGNIAAKYQDVAEWVDATEPLEAGTVVVIDPNGSNRVTSAGRAYESSVAGAVSPQPGLILGEAGEGRVLVAQSGRVRVKADATFGAIRPGDLLVTSPTSGHVMKSKPLKVSGQAMHRPGTLVGKALEGLDTGRGEILVLLTLQ